ncbi:hypothetical protein PG994_007959 [Apiospora phragmitis]|uniref:Uncharacterized protein n=1 Tax=Apiospora phragmitis TaxID=2905665 RepID=A0ABR1UUS3_9PEZI
MPDSAEDYAQKQKIPAIFSNLSKARETLESEWHVASYFTSGIRKPSEKPLPHPESGAWQEKSKSILARWSSAHDVYLDIRGDSLTEEKRRDTAALSILRELGSMTMMLTRTTVEDQRKWDVFCPMFQNIISLAQDIIELDRNSTTARPKACINMALVGPLFEYQANPRSEEKLSLKIFRSAAGVEILLFASEQSRFFKNVVERKGSGMLFQRLRLLKEF